MRGNRGVECKLREERSEARLLSEHRKSRLSFVNLRHRKPLIRTRAAVRTVFCWPAACSTAASCAGSMTKAAAGGVHATTPNGRLPALVSSAGSHACPGGPAHRLRGVALEAGLALCCIGGPHRRLTSPDARCRASDAPKCVVTLCCAYQDGATQCHTADRRCCVPCGQLQPPARAPSPASRRHPASASDTPTLPLSCTCT